MVNSTLERLGLSEHIPKIKHPHPVEFLVGSNEADKFLLLLGTEDGLAVHHARNAMLVDQWMMKWTLRRDLMWDLYIESSAERAEGKHIARQKKKLFIAISLSLCFR